ETTNKLALIATGGNVQDALERYLVRGVKPPSVPGYARGFLFAAILLSFRQLNSTRSCRSDGRHPFFGADRAADKHPASLQPRSSLGSQPSNAAKAPVVDSSMGASSRPPPCVPGAQPLSDELMSSAVMQALSLATESKPQPNGAAAVNLSLDPLASKPGV